MRRVLAISETVSIVAGMAAIVFFAFAAQAAPTVQQTRIETDQKSGVIRFIVKGREEARIDAAGLHVRQGIDYGGALTDIGASAYGSIVQTKAQPGAAEKAKP